MTTPTNKTAPTNRPVTLTGIFVVVGFALSLHGTVSTVADAFIKPWLFPQEKAASLHSTIVPDEQFMHRPVDGPLIAECDGKTLNLFVHASEGVPVMTYPQSPACPREAAE